MKRTMFLSLAASLAVGCVGAAAGGPSGPTTGQTGASGSGAAGTSTSGHAGVGGAGPSGMAGTGATGGIGGSATAGAQGSTAGTQGSLTTGSGGSCAANGVPPDVQDLLTTRCIACHGNPPIAGVPASFASYAGLTAPSKTDPTKTNVQLAIARMQSATMPMPPAPLMRATAAEIAVMQHWVTAGSPASPCAGDAGATDASPTVVDPFASAPVCTSKKTWTGGNKGSASMNPGVACIACHSMGEGPRYAIAGTLYPTAHEPDLCDGVSSTGGTQGAEVVIFGASGQMLTLTPNSAGNFFYSGTLAEPYQAKVVYQGRERAMIESQTSGDCNNCHTQDGAMPSGTLKAPGRILLP